MKSLKEQQKHYQQNKMNDQEPQQNGIISKLIPFLFIFMGAAMCILFAVVALPIVALILLLLFINDVIQKGIWVSIRSWMTYIKSLAKQKLAKQTNSNESDNIIDL